MVMERSCHGLILAITSSFFFSVCSLVAKFLVDFHPLQLTSFSFLGIVFVSGLIALSRGENLLPKSYFPLLLLRSTCGTIFLMSSFYSVQVLPLGDASVLFYTAPVFTLLLARCILKEPCPPHSGLIVITIAVGVILVTQPPEIFGKADTTLSEQTDDGSLYWTGVLAALMASLSEAVGNITLRQLKGLHYSVILLNYGVISLLQTLIGSYYIVRWTFPEDHQLSLIILLGAFTTAEQILMTLALRVEHAGPVALVQASDIVYGYIYQVMFFGESFNVYSALGAILVAMVVVYMTTEKLHKQSSSVRSLTHCV